ncbi:MAG: hypothetical protein OEM63_10725 [Gammaproteobacteria bacterium]|nr:hypothetical protein [Gammaproteobacteria bacterium]
MSETAQHQTEAQEPFLEAINELVLLDLDGLSFVQLKRLENILQQAREAVAAESLKRAQADNSGDTVNVPSPKV